MHLSQLTLQNLRCFKDLTLDLGPGISVFYGQNGAGKTSILEAIDFLSRGKSFRSAQFSDMVQHDQQKIMVSAQLEQEDGSKDRLGVLRDTKETQLKCNGETVKRWSELAQRLPVLAIHPESFQLVMGGPVERRKFLDWGMFHVEPEYRKHLQMYSKALAQRNLCLKEQLDASPWNKPMADSGERIDAYRRHYCQELTPLVNYICDELALGAEVDLQYQSGWAQGEKLADQLQLELQQSPLPNFSSVGPHRAEVHIYWQGRKFSKSSSRGQQKILAVAMRLAQSLYLYETQERTTLYLVDELPAELDKLRCERILSMLQELDSQTLITTVSAESVKYGSLDAVNWFHVEHQQVKAVL